MSAEAQPAFSDYVIFVDESGDHSLEAIDPEYPVFVLSIIEAADFTLFAVVIDKRRLMSRYSSPAHPYHLAMEFGLERIYRFLGDRNQGERRTFVVCEARGRKEDKDLELEFRRICAGGNYFNRALPFELVMADKKTNSEGLQLADLTARPIGLSVLRPDQPNRAMAVLCKKLYRNRLGETSGVGLKCFP